MIAKSTKLFLMLFAAMGCFIDANAEDLDLINLSKGDALSRTKNNLGKASIVNHKGSKALKVELGAKGNYPGIAVYPENGRWDLSAYDGVEMELVNLTDRKISVALRADNHGANGKDKCNTERMMLPPGGTGKLPVTFGISFGNEGAEINKSNIIAFQIFGSKDREDRAFLVKSIKAFKGEREEVSSRGNNAIPMKKDDSLQFVKITSYPASITMEEKPAVINLNGGEFTTRNEEVISGSKSLLGDSKGKGRKWFEFAKTAVGYFAPGSEYEITFKYKVINIEEGAKFYGFLRSKGQGWGKWDRNWTYIENLKADGKVHTAVIKTGLPNFRDYQFNFGINGVARIAIDDIRISKGKAYIELDAEEEKIKAIPKSAVLHKKWNFEEEHADLTMRHLGKITQDNPISGKKSLFINTMKRKGKWNVALSVGKEQFPDNNKYHVYMKTKSLEWTKGSNAYVVVKRADIQKDIVWKRWRGPIGKTVSTYLSFEVAKGQQAYMDLAIFKKGRMIVDEIVIMRESLDNKAILTHKGMVRTDENLIFSEEFNGTSLNKDVWNVYHEPRTGGWWHPNNVSVKDNNLVLAFTKEDTHYAMGALNTKGKFEFKYGYAEVRMKVNKEEGHWPGMWLFTDSTKKVGNEGRDGTEIDIVECPWVHKDIVSHALHWDGYSLDHQNAHHKAKVPGLHEGYHTFAVDWSPAGYIFYINGKETWRTDAGGVCNVPLYIILSDEMGGWSGDPKKAKNLPDYTYVDYFKVWQSKEYKELSEKE